jgi:hypothetical protein
MFKKIHSNREPGTSVYRELKKEFGTYFDWVEACVRRIATNYPQQVFALMVFAMVVSMVLSFTYFRTKELENGKTAIRQGNYNQRPVTMTGQFGQLMETTALLQETLELKKHIEAILSKKKLAPADSAELVKALDRLRIIQKPIKTNK